MTKITIEHSNGNGREQGYGLYINAVAYNTIWASKCLSSQATQKQIKAAEKQVRRRGLYKLNRELEK